MWLTNGMPRGRAPLFSKDVLVLVGLPCDVRPSFGLVVAFPMISAERWPLIRYSKWPLPYH